MDRYFYATVYRDFYKKLSSLTNSREDMKIRRFVQDLCRLDKREEEYNFIMYWRGTKENPNTVNRRLDKKYFGIDELAELNPEYYGYVKENPTRDQLIEEYKKEHKDDRKYHDNDGVRGDLEKDAQAYADEKSANRYSVTKGNQTVEGHITQVSEEQQKEILQRARDESGYGMSDAQLAESQEHRVQRKKEYLQTFSYEDKKQAKEKRKELRKDWGKEKVEGLKNKNKVIKFVAEHFLLLLKVFLIIMIIWTILNAVIVLIGSFQANFGKIPYALCINDKEDTKTGLYYVSVPSATKTSLMTYIQGKTLEANFDNFVTEEESGISFKGSIKYSEKHKTEFPIPTSVRECTNCDYSPDISDLITKNKTKNLLGTVSFSNAPRTSIPIQTPVSTSTTTPSLQYTPGTRPVYNSPLQTPVVNPSTNTSSNTSSSSTTPVWKPALSIGSDFNVTELVEGITSNPLSYAQSGLFTSHEDSGFTIKMRWEYAKYHVDSNGKITNVSKQSNDDIKAYKEWLQKQKIIVFNPYSKKYVVAQPKIVEGEGGVKDLDWGPMDTKYVASISDPVAKALGFTQGEADTQGISGRVEESGFQLGYYFVPEDTSVGLVSKASANSNVVYCSAMTVIASGPWEQWKQFGSPWSNIPLGTTGGTIGTIGCAATSVSMAIAKLGLTTTGIEGEYNPGSAIQAMARAKCFSEGGGITWACPSNIAPDLTVENFSVDGLDEKAKTAKLANYIMSGAGLVCQVKGHTDGTHFVFIHSVQNGRLLMADPGYNKATNDLFVEYPYNQVTDCHAYRNSKF